MTGLDKEQLKKDIKEELLKSDILTDRDDSEGIEFTSLCSIFRKKWKLILFITLAVAVLSVIYALSLPNYYKSSASVYLFSKNNYSSLSAFINNVKSDSLMDSGEVSFLNTSLKSDSMSEFIINKFGIATNPAVIGNKILKEEDLILDKVLFTFKQIVAINYDSNNNLITISAETMSATTSAEIVNAYLEKLEDFTNNPQKEKLRFIENQLSKISKELEKAENELKDYQEKHNLFSLEKQSSIVISKLVSLEAQKNEVEFNIGWLKNYIEKNDVLNGNTDEIKLQVDAYNWKKAEIEQKILELEKELKEFPDNSMEFTRLKRNLSVKEKIFEILNEQYEIAKIAEAEEGCQYKIIDRPRVSKLKSKPYRKSICILYTFAAFVFSIGLAVVLEYTGKPNTTELPQAETEVKA
ncbi:MAG: hypothetical protein II567_16350 [Candidatus Riflebacteria bacterium]|nr:hypothetical protein [Candidatus Riflebacteria bacterium]